MRILGIETSCDETGLAIFDENQGLLGHVLYSQIQTHAPFGGVVPELASRDHILKLAPLLQELLRETQTELPELSGIAYTKGPGLIGALMVGAGFAKALGFALNKPVIGIHHMEGHLLAALLEQPAPHFPFLALLVSGGHTQLVDVRALGKYHVLGESLDDAAGEAFDKTAKLLELPYPGGPKLAALALKGKPNRFQFPKPLTDKPTLNFSFSGLKTFALNTFNQCNQTEQDKADIAYAFQEAVVDTLYLKCKRALKETQHTYLVIAGGVGANQSLRTKLKMLENELPVQVFYPRPEFCTDNGAMIAYAGYLHLKKNPDVSLDIEAQARWPMESC